MKTSKNKQPNKVRKAQQGRPVNWMTLVDAAKHLSVSKETMYRLIYDKKNKFPARRLGKLYRFSTDEIDAWVRSQC
jgi:excisionase family DNA binding protein